MNKDEIGYVAVGVCTVVLHLVESFDDLCYACS